MKKIIALSLVVFFAGCSFQAKYDNNEYASVVRIVTIAGMAEHYCSDPAIVKSRLADLEYEAHFLTSYTKHLPKNEDAHAISNVLLSQVNEMKARYNAGEVSEGYCKAKFKIMRTGGERALEALGQKVK